MIEDLEEGKDSRLKTILVLKLGSSEDTALNANAKLMQVNSPRE
jgi:hypothetical protein